MNKPIAYTIIFARLTVLLMGGLLAILSYAVLAITKPKEFLLLLSTYLTSTKQIISKYDQQINKGK